MPIDTCITNVGEYYSSHYLDSTFAKDVKELLAKWNEQGSQAPPRRLQSLSQHYFRAKSLALDEVDPVRRREAGDEVHGWHAHLIQALGYHDLTPFDHPVEGGDAFVPTLGRVNRYNKPWLVVCESHFCLPDGSLKEGQPSEDPLSMEPNVGQLVNSTEHALCAGDWTRCVGRLFSEEDAPRWILLLAGSQVLLLDRNTFAQGRFLAFDLDDAFGRKEKDTFNHLAAFLAAETLCPGGESDEVLHDKLEEQNHRFAHGVTENLQYAVREAIELLANEWVEDRRAKGWSYTRLRAEEADIGVAHGFPQGEDGGFEVTAEHLKHEALTFVYRLLFCFYAEARGGELEILPMEEDAYRLGYSLESLRDLEQVPLTAATETGVYFHEHLKKLFGLIHAGFYPHEQDQLGRIQRGFATETVRTFTMRPLTATLFSPESTPLLNRAKLSNLCLQKVILRLSLSRDDKSKTVGRVNYAELGINQLGAVYEGLLSYRGMFADQDLIHVKPADKDIKDNKTPSWFVPKERIDEFEKDEVERDESGKSRVYVKGRFILHLNGIDREQSASYYTPEVLTKCLVEEALRELLKDYTPADADKILDLKICEPAMGSGAFLNEAAAQLAHKYLELKQKQLDQSIEPARYGDELGRVKHYIATRNIYGVDLNATAVELGALSLWLGSIHRLLVKRGENGGRDQFVSGATPWFGLRLRCGNSLIGARRAVWTVEQLKTGKHGGKESEVPRLLKPGEQRAANEIYHFLVFDEEMIPTHGDALMRKFWPERCAAGKKWIAQQVKPKWTTEQLREALEVSRLIDHHWVEYTMQRLKALQCASCTSTVWPIAADSNEATKSGPSLLEQESLRSSLESTSGGFQRLKLIMDAWCALWFWALDHVSDLPTRDAYLAFARLLLGATPPNASLRPLLSARLGFEIDVLLSASENCIPNTDMLAEAIPWSKHSQRRASELVFHHWELAFPEVLALLDCAKGFDLFLGNPPWLLADWNEEAVVCELEPILGAKGEKSAVIQSRKDQLLASHDARRYFCNASTESLGQSAFLNSGRVYSALSGIRSNLYKNFIVQSWGLLRTSGVGAILHPSGVYDDPSGGAFRAVYYPRLRFVYSFSNELKLFSDVHNRTLFAINIFSPVATAISFSSASLLFHPSTIAVSRNSLNQGPVPGLKNAHGRWDLSGHSSRILTIQEEELKLFARLFEDEDTEWSESRLPQLHNSTLLSVLRRFSETSRICDGDEERLFATMMINESHGQRDGQITRCDSPTFQPKSPYEWVVSGPHFHIGNPLSQSPRTVSRSNRSYDDIDLATIADNYLPRALYRPGDKNGDRSEFAKAIPVWPPRSNTAVTERYSIVYRAMGQVANERTMIASIMPRGVTAIHTVLSVYTQSDADLALLAGISFSIAGDFLIKVRGKGNVYGSDIRRLPTVSNRFAAPIRRRVMRLTCLTGYYSELWRSVVDSDIASDRWAVIDNRLQQCGDAEWADLRADEWSPESAVRSDLARRQALLEIDVLVALGLGISLAELTTMFRSMFPVTQEYDLADFYDSRGARVPNTARKDQGAKEVREAMHVSRGGSDGASVEKASEVRATWTVDDGRRIVTKAFLPPIGKFDREADYAFAFAAFQKRWGGVR